VTDGAWENARRAAVLYLESVPHWLWRTVQIWSFCIAGSHLGGDPVLYPSLASPGEAPDLGDESEGVLGEVAVWYPPTSAMSEDTDALEARFLIQLVRGDRPGSRSDYAKSRSV
jgi:hypothetical protein